jgi:phage-related protein
MSSIGAGVFELKDQDDAHWYRMVYLARIKDTIYVLHCFTKDTARTEKRDIATAERRLKQVQQRLREEVKDEKRTPR